MAKLETASQFIELVESGRYTNEVNAKRGAGRTRLSKAEKDKVFAFIEKYFNGGASATASKPGKKASKKVRAAKKVAVRKPARAAQEDEGAEELLEDEEVEEVEDQDEDKVPESGEVAPKKKATSKRGPKGKAAPGSLPLAPNEAKTVADVLQIVDSTVHSSVSVINALKQANEVSNSAPIDAGIERIKLALEGAAKILYNSVMTHLASSTPSADPDVASRLEAVVAASHQTPLAHEAYGTHNSLQLPNS